MLANIIGDFFVKRKRNRNLLFFLGIIFCLFFAFPAGSAGPGSGSAGPDINPLRYDTLGELIDAIAYVLLFLSIILTPTAIIVGGFLMTTGIPSRQILGKKIIIYSLAIFFAIIITKWVTSLTKDIIG